jgi:hypothetical protein
MITYTVEGQNDTTYLTRSVKAHPSIWPSSVPTKTAVDAMKATLSSQENTASELVSSELPDRRERMSSFDDTERVAVAYHSPCDVSERVCTLALWLDQAD